MKNLSVENVYTRASAKELAKKYFWKLLGMLAIVLGITYAITFGGTALLALGGNETVFAIGYIVLMVVMVLVASGLSMGLYAAMIDLCRGNETVTVGRVFSRMGKCLKAFGLSLWVGLKTFLWMLPGYVVVLVSAFAVLSFTEPTTGTISESSAGTMALLMFGGMLLMFILGIPAVYRYMLSTYILADNPDTGVFESVRQSKAMMKGHKWQAFKLVLPIILIMYVIVLVLSVAMGAVMALLANTPAAMTILSIVLMVVIIAAMLYYMIRMYLCYTLFYLKRVEEQNPAQEAVEAPYTE